MCGFSFFFIKRVYVRENIAKENDDDVDVDDDDDGQKQRTR